MHVFMNPTHKPTDFYGYVGQFSFDVIPASRIPPPHFQPNPHVAPNKKEH